MDNHQQFSENLEKTTTKLQFKTNDELWNRVLEYKLKKRLSNTNDAVEELIKKSLEPSESNKEIYYQITPSQDVIETINNFRKKIPIYEREIFAPLLILYDKKSGAFYSECHVHAKDLIELGDPDAVIDPELQAEFRANRQLEPDNFYFLQMVDDATNGRPFSDIVLEYNLSYKPSKPLKILGGQHRHEAVVRALKKDINVIHGVRIYFNLNDDQRAEIMRISNTNINVSPDLRDRIEEQRLKPAGMLRNFCYNTGILKSNEDFGDKRKNEGFTPTVRMMRGFIVNFYAGKSYNGEIDKDAAIPYLPDSGKKIDTEYMKIFNQYKSKEAFNDPDLVDAGKNFAKLHEVQFKNADKIPSPAKKEYKIKAFNLAIITSWAFAAGALQTSPQRLRKFYDLPNLSGTDDPLNAQAMSKAHHKSDPETYRGLATRTDLKERGRVLQLFLGYSQSLKPKITELMCNAAIDLFHSNQSRISAEKKTKEAF